MGIATLARVFVPFALGYFLSYLYRVVNAVIAPDLVDDVGLGPDGLGLLTAAYFITFAASQLPLGVLLDRYEPRKVEALLLVFAAAGAAVFALARGAPGLILGRALIGLGVSACLMAAFRAFVTWFPAGRLPLVNGLQMAAGGLGALSATAPVAWTLQFTDWRGLFLGLAVLTLVVAAAVFLLVPPQTESPGRVSLREQIRGVREVFASPRFWRIAPWATASQASFLSVQGLWAGPWLHDVGGLDRAGVARVLSWVAAAMVLGFLSLGTIAERLGKAGIRPMTVASIGMIAFWILQLMVACNWTSSLGLLWVAYGFFGTSGILTYAALSQDFPRSLAGRVNTALNLLVFVAAFAAQWGLGVLMGYWPTGPQGSYSATGYSVGMIVLLGVQGASMVWYLVVRPRRSANGAAPQQP
jgi:MFS family permease